MYTRTNFANELKDKVNKKQSVEEIGHWAYEIYMEHIEYICDYDDELGEILLTLNHMEDGTEFALSYQRLNEIADDLISGKKDINLDYGCCAQVLAEEPNEIEIQELLDKKKIFFIIDGRDFQIGYRSNTGEYTQKAIEKTEIVALLRKYAAGENIHDENDVNNINNYLSSFGCRTLDY